MSKGSKRQSAKQVEQTFNYIFEKPSVTPVKSSQKKPWLTMTDDEIDLHYASSNRRYRGEMKREAAIERQREHVRNALRVELEESTL